MAETQARNGCEEDVLSNATSPPAEALFGHTQSGYTSVQEVSVIIDPLLQNVEQEQSTKTNYFSCLASSDKPIDFGWGNDSSENLAKKHVKFTRHFPIPDSFALGTEDSCWKSFDWMPSAMLPVDEPYLSSSIDKETDLDGECSDVDLDNDWVTSGNSDSDASINSLQNGKQSKWLRPFFQVLNEVAETERDSTRFYCPACRGSGLGETDLYRGLKPLIKHAKSYKKRRAKLHRQFGAILEEDLKNSGTIQPMDAYDDEAFQRQLVENEKLKDALIVWPPMVLIKAAGVELTMLQKMVRMQTKEYLKAFKDFCPRRVRHAYDPADESGCLSLLIFLDSPIGYMQAKQLAKKFKNSGRGRKQWGDSTLKMQSCCDQQMYAYMATEEDMMYFETCDGASKKKLLWSMKSFKESVVQPLVEMRELKLENDLLKAQLQEQEVRISCLETCLAKFHKNLRLTEEEAFVAQEIALRH